MEYITPFIDKYNTVAGILIAVATWVFGEHWWLFAAYFLLNIADWLTGWLKARLKGVSSSTVATKGCLKKLGYWVMIALGFGMSAIFIEIGQIIGVDLGITTIFGWFILANLFVNEIRSIIENFVEAGYNVPAPLRKGLAVAEEMLEKDEPSTNDILEKLSPEAREEYERLLQLLKEESQE